MMSEDARAVPQLLAGKTCVVMGIQNKWSIAYAIAETMALAGGRLALTYIDERAKRDADSLIERFPDAKGYTVNVSNDEDLDRIDRLGENDRLHAALDALPEDQRAALVARYVDDETYDETAERLRTSSAVVRKRASRGLARLRDQMRGWA